MEQRRRQGGGGGGKLPRMMRLTAGKSREGSSGPAGVVLREKRTVPNLTAASGPGGPSGTGQKEKEKKEEKDAGGQKDQRKSRYSVALASSELAVSFLFSGVAPRPHKSTRRGMTGRKQLSRHLHRFRLCAVVRSAVSANFPIQP